MKNQNNQLLKLWFLQATEALCHLIVTDIKKTFCNIFCKNEACVNCGTLNATTLIWLLIVVIPMYSAVEPSKKSNAFLNLRNKANY
jgi:hypothetical protein